MIEATLPNCINNSLPVKYNTPKPMAAVMLAIKVVMAIRSMVILSANCLSPCFLSSFWYLFNNKILFGIPIITISGGIRPVKIVSSKPNNTSVPMLQITPITTTKIGKKTA
ncbi:hypothetical protein D3C73_876040 [compost metagenome]